MRREGNATTAPGNGCPLASTTRPLTVLRSWANSATGSIANATNTRRAERSLSTVYPLGCYGLFVGLAKKNAKFAQPSENGIFARAHILFGLEQRRRHNK